MLIENPQTEVDVNCSPARRRVSLPRSSHLHSIPSEEEEEEFGRRPGSSFCDSSEPSFLERMSHVLEDPLPPPQHTTPLSNTPRQHKQTRMSTASSSIRFAPTEFIPTAVEPSVWSMDRRQFVSERSSLRSLQAPVLSPRKSAPLRDMSPPISAASPPRPMRKASTASDISPSVVEALVGAYSADRPSTFCISTPRHPHRLHRSDDKEDSVSSVASTVAVATPSMENYVSKASLLGPESISVFQDFPKFVSKSISKLDSPHISKFSILLNILMLCFFLFTYRQIHSEVVSMRDVLTRLESQLSVTHLSTVELPSMMSTHPPPSSSSYSSEAYEANQPQSPALSEKVAAPSSPARLTSWKLNVMKEIFGTGVPLRIRPRKKPIYMSSQRSFGLSSVLNPTFFFLCFLCKIVITTFATLLIRSGLFTLATAAFISAVFRINLFAMIKSVPWLRVVQLLTSPQAASSADSKKI